MFVCHATFCVFVNVFLLPFTKFESKTIQLQKDSLGKSYERILVSDFAIMAQKWSNIALVFVNHPSCLPPFSLFKKGNASASNG